MTSEQTNTKLLAYKLKARPKKAFQHWTERVTSQFPESPFISKTHVHNIKHKTSTQLLHYIQLQYKYLISNDCATPISPFSLFSSFAFTSHPLYDDIISNYIFWSVVAEIRSQHPHLYTHSLNISTKTQWVARLTYQLRCNLTNAWSPCTSSLPTFVQLSLVADSINFLKY